MKKLLTSLIASAVVAAGTYAYADQHNVKPVTAPAKVAANKTQEQATTELTVYANPSDSAATIAKVNVNQRLVPFFHQGEWIKVGDPKDGKVGWINKDQYRKAVNAAIHQSVQMIYVDQSTDKDGKPQITVYQNGKKLSGDKAKAVYKKMQKQQASMQKRMQKFQHRMDRWMNQQMQMADQMMPMMQPIVIVENNQPQKPQVAPAHGPKPAKLAPAKPAPKNPPAPKGTN